MSLMSTGPGGAVMSQMMSAPTEADLAKKAKRSEAAKKAAATRAANKAAKAEAAAPAPAPAPTKKLGTASIEGASIAPKAKEAPAPAPAPAPEPEKKIETKMPSTLAEGKKEYERLDKEYNDEKDSPKQIEIQKKTKELIDNLIETGKATKKDSIATYIRNIKVGDTITYGKSSGYMGDGGDSRDVGYSVDGKVLKLLGSNKYEVEPRHSGNQPVIFVLDDDDQWLRHNENGYQVYYINKTRSLPYYPPATFERALANGFKRIAQKKSSAKKSADKEADWTKSTKDELITIIQEHLAKDGKRLGGVSTATKPKLIDYIRKNKIRE